MLEIINNKYLMDYWWFVHQMHEELWSKPDPSRGVPLNDLKYSKEGVKAVVSEVGSWIPMSPPDSFACEEAVRRDQVEVVVRPDRLAVVDVQLNLLRPVYWNGSRCPVRRSSWFMTGLASAPSSVFGVPFPAVLEKAVEKAYLAHESWIGEERSHERIVEKLVALERPFHEYMIVFTKGSPNQAALRPFMQSFKLTSLSANDESQTASAPLNGASKSDAFIQVYRGYKTLFMAVGQQYKLPKPLECAPEPQVIDHLILAVHGIGQKLAGKFGFGFIRDIAFLRDQINLAEKSRNLKENSIAVLPILWRPELNLPANYYHTESSTNGLSGFDLIVSRLVPESVPIIRSLFSDVALDILLYMTSPHRAIIFDSLLKELKRVYETFMKWNPEFNGKKHLIGHSLGSAIVADILTSNILGLDIDCFFALGAPVSLFFLLKHQRLIGCESRLTVVDTDSSKDGPTAVNIKAKSFYNIYHPHDPIAYRMEPLVDTTLSRLAPPCIIPYQKPGLTRFKLDIEERVSKAKNGLQSSISQTIKRFSSMASSLTSADTNGDKAISSPSSPPLNGYFAFNRRGRIDFVIQDSVLESAYLSSLSAHFTYWSDNDVAMFMVGEIIN